LRQECTEPLAASLLEQVAKEMGDVFTNRRAIEMMGKDGGPIEASHTFVLRRRNESLASANRFVLVPQDRVGAARPIGAIERLARLSAFKRDPALMLRARPARQCSRCADAAEQSQCDASLDAHLMRLDLIECHLLGNIVRKTIVPQHTACWRESTSASHSDGNTLDGVVAVI
jgi:hypothetical protein